MINVENLWFSYYPDKPVLKNINVVFEEGQLYFILGDNGSGKTTLVKHLNGLLKPEKGRVVVDGIDTREAPVSELSKKVSVVFQYPEKMFYLPTVKEELETTLKNFGVDVDEAEVKRILEEYGLERYLGTSPYRLSGGEQRILTIAIMSSWSPKYLVLDEPTVGLDGYFRGRLRNLILKRMEDGYTTIVVTHDIEFSMLFDSQLIILESGSIAYKGRSGDLADLHLSRYGLVKPTVLRAIEMMWRRKIASKEYAASYCPVFAAASGEVYRRLCTGRR